MQNGTPALALVDRNAPAWQRWCAGLVERLTGLRTLDEVARNLDRRLGAPTTRPTAKAWLGAARDWLRLDLDLPDGDLERVPQQGPVLVAAEHPTGAMEGVVLLSLLLRRRPDVKVLGNRWLARLPALADLVIPVDVFGEANPSALRAAVRHLRAGGLLLGFPAGEVARGRWFRRRPREGRWQKAFAGLQRLTDAPVVPVHVGARSGKWLERLAAVHPLLRTLLLPRTLLDQQQRPVALRVGHTIAPSQLERFPATADQERADYLRLRTEILARRVAGDALPALPKVSPQEPIAPRGDVDALAAEIGALPAASHLLTSNGLQVVCARASAIPHTLAELGRLREWTFRAAGEGSGKARDLDRFDADYHHLFVWDPAAREIVGSYRLGPTDELRAAGGDAAVYSSGFHTFAPEFWHRVGPALELGRSFVQPAYQRQFAPLLLLWRGIGAFVARNPRYRHLFGLVSIAADHHATSVRLMVDHLRSHCRADELAPFVRTARPWRAGFFERRSLTWRPEQIAALPDVSAMVRELETNRAGVPILLEQYLKLGARLLGVNVDPDFHTIDALVVIDLLRTPPHLLGRYLGDAGRASLQAHHGGPQAAGA
ncbi:MAG: GNAT family N-acyltransferase [Planctomycetota bacterium]